MSIHQRNGFRGNAWFQCWKIFPLYQRDTSFSEGEVWGFHCKSGETLGLREAAATQNSAGHSLEHPNSSWTRGWTPDAPSNLTYSMKHHTCFMLALTKRFISSWEIQTSWKEGVWELPSSWRIFPGLYHTCRCRCPCMDPPLPTCDLELYQDLRADADCSNKHYVCPSRKEQKLASA